MLPKPGVPLDRTTQRLQELIFSIDQKSEPVDYALWAADAETMLRECFVDIPLERLYTERYWRLTSGPVAGTHWMLRQEQTVIREWLERIKGTVETMKKRFATPVATIVVPDTNIILHAKPLHEIPWRARLATETPVRIAIPIRVVDELDEKKYNPRQEDLRKRARNRLTLLGRQVDGDQALPAGVTVEIVSWRDLDLSRVPRPLVDPDDDILDMCEALSVYANMNACFVATTDTGMKLKAKERGLPVAYLGGDLHVGLAADDSSHRS